MRKCPICYRDYFDSVHKCECGYEEFNTNQDDEEFCIYKFAKSIFLDKIEWKDSPIRVIQENNENIITDIDENQYSIAKVTKAFDKETIIDDGVLALNRKVKALIINVESVNSDFLDETSVSSLFFGDRFHHLENDCIRLGGHLRHIEVSKNNLYFMADNQTLFSKDKTILYKYPSNKNEEEYFVPSSVKRICSYAFYSFTLKKLHISKNVKLDSNAIITTNGLEIIYGESI